MFVYDPIIYMNYAKIFIEEDSFLLHQIIMKIAVAGMGVAGAYLMNRLSDDHENHVVGFERMDKDKHDAVCAWATCKNVMTDLAKNCGLNFDEYILHEGKQMEVDLGTPNRVDINLKGMVSYDK